MHIHMVNCNTSIEDFSFPRMRNTMKENLPSSSELFMEKWEKQCFDSCLMQLCGCKHCKDSCIIFYILNYVDNFTLTKLLLGWAVVYIG